MEESLVVFDGGRLTALDPATGAVRWVTALPDCGPLYGRMAILEGVILIAGYEWLYCCNLQTGQPLWRVATPKAARVGVMARGGRVFVYCNGTVECYDGRGQRLWRRDGDNPYGASMGFAGDVCWIMDQTSV